MSGEVNGLKEGGRKIYSNGIRSKVEALLLLIPL
jgi:hypothetical protein